VHLPTFPVPDRRFHHRFVWLALLGWLAQAFVPMAHAGAMAQRTAHHGWCNTGVASAGSAVLAQKIAALPGDIRRIITQDFPSSTTAGSDCAQLCATAAPGGLPPTPPALALSATAEPTVRCDAVVAGHGSPIVPPPARGPPLQAS
jgi:hypothetical protein